MKSSFDLVALPVDGSQSSYIAFELAKLFLTPASTLAITPIHVWGDWQPYIHDILFPFAPLGSDSVDFEREIELAALSWIYRWLKTDSSDLILNQPLVCRGTCRTLLPHIILSQAFDLVAVGAVGSQYSPHGTLGSVALQVVRQATIPVLFARSSLLAPKIERITVPFDLTPNSHLLIEKALHLAYFLQADMDILYVLPNPSSSERNHILDTAIDLSPDEILMRAEEKINCTFDALVRKLDVPFPMRHIMTKALQDRCFRVGDPVDEIIAHSIENKTHLLVLSKHDPSIERQPRIGRVTRQLMERGPCHLFIVPLSGGKDSE